MMKQKLALLLTALLLLTGCASGGSGDTADGQDDGELETIDVVLDWYPNAVHAFLYEAEEKGYFAEEGLQVNILFPSNASDPLTDEGPGIPPEDLERIFNRTYTVSSARTPGSATGSGLGLAIVKTITERHGGTVSCENASGAGSIFSVTLPAKFLQS